MREEIEQLLGTRITDLVMLELALLFQQNPAFVDRAEAIARRLQRDPRAVADALAGLVESGIIETFELGSGKYILYSYTRDPDLRALLDGLSHSYHNDPAARAAIVKRLMGVGR